MTKRISDHDLIAIEADLAHLDAEYVKVMDNPDPALEGFINGLLDRTSTLEEKALARVPMSLFGLAVQARIVARFITCDSMAAKLIANIQTLSGDPALKPGIRLRHGKRYRDHQGRVTARLDQMDSRGLFFGDNCSGSMYEVDGRMIGWDRTEDLVEEIIPERRPKKNAATRERAYDQFPSQESVAA